MPFTPESQPPVPRKGCSDDNADKLLYVRIPARLEDLKIDSMTGGTYDLTPVEKHTLP